VFRDLHLPRYVFQETKPIYHLESHVKKEVLKDFLRDIAKARFVFSPRGIGSSSFRAYQSLMVGSIPIITGMNDYPFKNEVDWDSFCFRGGEGPKWSELSEKNLEEVTKLTSKAMSISDEQYEEMRTGGMQFWDEYCRHDSLYKKIKEIV
jgi:hypothetical protein